MGKRLILPYAIIAIMGIFVVIIISYIGVEQRNAIQNPEEAETEVLDAEDIFKKSCASCHGGDLSGVADTPALTSVGDKFSEDEIAEIINNGTEGGMPPALVNPEEAAEIAEWLSEMD